MQTYLSGKVSLSTHVKGKPRKVPVWELRYRLPSGKHSDKVLGKAWTQRSRPPVGYLTRAQAEKAKYDFLDAHAEDTPADRKTLGRAVEDFLQRKRDKGLVGGTLRSYENIGKLLCQRGGDRPWKDRMLDSFKPDDLVAVRTELVRADREPGTINQWRVIVRGTFGTHRGSPSLEWAWKPLSNDPKNDLDFYDPEEISSLLGAAVDDTDRAIFTLAVQAGPRKSEIRALRVKDCDFSAHKLRFNRGFTNEEGFAANKGKELRSVPMSPDVAACLRPLCEGKQPDDLVFTPERGAQAICGSALYRRFIAAADVAGLRRIRFHDLRHSFGTRAIQKFHVYEVQRMMGHKHITTTERYLHYKEQPDDAERMGALWATADVTELPVAA